jgi:hypothetical protein
MLNPCDFDNLEEYFGYADFFYEVPQDLLWVEFVLLQLLDEKIISQEEQETTRLCLYGRENQWLLN